VVKLKKIPSQINYAKNQNKLGNIANIYQNLFNFL